MRNSSGALQERWYSGSGWSAWTTVPALSGVTFTMSAGNRRVLFARATDKTIRTNAWDYTTNR